MVYSVFRYLGVGIALVTGVLLLAVSALGDPAAMITRLRATAVSSGILAGSDTRWIADSDPPHHEQPSASPQAADGGAQGAPAQQKSKPSQRPSEPVPATKNGMTQPELFPRGAGSKQTAASGSGTAAPSSPTPNVAAPPPASADAIPRRLLLLEASLAQGRRQDAERFLESMLFQLVFRSGESKVVPETVLMIRQALAAVAAADLEKAAFYTEQARPSLEEYK